MRSFRNIAFAAALAAGAGLSPAFAQDDVSFPRLTGSGEGLSIEYGPGPRGNILGGGAVTVRDPHGEGREVVHHGARYAQRRDDGLVPVLTGSGEGLSVAYEPHSVPTSPSFAELLRRLRG